ncbi:MAG: class I SAM-dependent rRNA methyltransferase [Litorilinea sp.]
MTQRAPRNRHTDNQDGDNREGGNRAAGKRGSTIPFVQAAARIKPALAQGHPWIYREAVDRAPKGLASGTWVHVQCGNLQAYGLWDAEGPIAVRLFASRRPPNRAWVAACVEQAWQRRAPLRGSLGNPSGDLSGDFSQDPAQTISAYRWLYGESDGLPGVVVDLYGHVDGHVDGQIGQVQPAEVVYWAVVRIYSPSVALLLPWVVDALVDVAARAGIVLAGVVERGADAPVLHVGDMPPTPLMLLEYGVRFEADLIQGQKTGFFLDQRENRRMIGQWSRGRRVLNLFAYTGGFSVFAALGGATHVTSVDSAAPAMAAAARNFTHNGLDPAAHEFVTADCFELLEKYHGEGRRFDLIVVDPPSFARARAQLDKALHAYTRLNALAMKCLEPGGILASSSCTSQVGPEAFRLMLAEAAAEAKRRALILHEAGHAPDHPVLAGFAEARYLKFVLATVEPLG